MIDFIKILAIIPFSFIFSFFIFILTSNSPLKSRFSYKDFRREFLISRAITIPMYFILSCLFAFVIVCFTDFGPVVQNSDPNSMRSVNDFFYNVQKFINNPYFFFCYSLSVIFLSSIILFVLFQNKNKKVALKNLDANAEDNGFIQPIYDAAKYNKGLIIETVDNTIYKGMCLYLNLDRDSTSTEKYVCFLVFEKLFYDKNKREFISIYKDYDLLEKIINAKDGNQIIPNLKKTPKTYYKEIEFSKYFEIYNNHSVIFKLSDIKTISYF